jgi:hypothetical protein
VRVVARLVQVGREHRHHLVAVFDPGVQPPPGGQVRMVVRRTRLGRGQQLDRPGQPGRVQTVRARTGTVAAHHGEHHGRQPMLIDVEPRELDTSTLDLPDPVRDRVTPPRDRRLEPPQSRRDLPGRLPPLAHVQQPRPFRRAASTDFVGTSVCPPTSVWR